MTWPEIWAIARYDLRLTDDEVGRMTLGTFDALLGRRNEELNRLQFHAGIVAAEVFNRLRPEKADPVDALDFVPEWKAKHRPQTLDEQIFVLTAAMGCGPAKPGEGFDRGARKVA